MSDERPRARPVEPTRLERQIAFRTGISAESRAAAFLIAKGFRILARRWRCPLGEIDIVARRRRLLVFVEVKARESLDDAASATSASMPCWWRPAAFRAISRRRSTPAAEVVLEDNR